MKTKPLTFLLSLTFLFLFSGSVFGQEEVKKEYWDNGKLKSEIHYKNGEKDGLETNWDYRGEKDYETHWKNGEKDGLYTKFLYGSKWIEIHYKNGKEDGLETEWYESGAKKNEAHFKNGKEDGLETRWYINGRKNQGSCLIFLALLLKK